MASNKSKNPLRPLVLWVSVLYLLVLCGVLYSLEHCTEQQWYFGALLYLPVEGWLLPLVILTPLALLARPSVCLLHVAAVMAVYAGYLHSPEPLVVAAKGEEPTLTVITANIGQRKIRNLQPFLDDKVADVIAFQEMVILPKKFLRDNPDYNLRAEGEFVIASKLPIKKSGIVPDLTFEGRPIAAWFELQYQKRSVVIYNVHMPTPRPYLTGLYDSGGEELLVESTRNDYKDYWTQRFALARGLLTALSGEKRPTLVVGDFNTPDHGGLYKMFAAQWVDSFAVAGSDGGYTFPADSRGRLSALGPWLRLDYLFAGQDWRPLECTVEPPVRTQHLAVMGRYELLATK